MEYSGSLASAARTTAIDTTALPKVRFFSRALLLLVYLPILHTTLAVLFAYSSSGGDSADLDWVWMSQIFLRLGLLTGLMFTVLYLVELGPVPHDATISTWGFIAKYFLVFLLCLPLLALVVSAITTEQILKPNFVPMGPLMIATFEILLTAALRSVLRQQQVNHSLILSNRNTQFHMLRAQLNPHFLFNSLNLISSEIDNDPTLAGELIDKLSDLMRGSLAATEKPTISLGEEFTLLEQYLDIQQSRFGARLRFEILYCESDSGLRIPPMISQPLVENAIKHGIAPLKTGGAVCVKATNDESYLIISIEDNGTGFTPDRTPFGHGLNLVKDSVELLYAHDVECVQDCFEIQSATGQGTSVTLRLPLIPEKPKRTYTL